MALHQQQAPSATTCASSGFQAIDRLRLDLLMRPPRQPRTRPS